MPTTVNPALAVFTYKRLDHTRKTIEKLQQNTIAGKIDLYVFSDGPKTEEERPDIAAVRNYLEAIDGFNSVSLVKNEINQGLAKSIIDGVSSVLLQYESVIVIEDDILTCNVALEYFFNLLEKYRAQTEVFSISANCETPRPFELPTTYEFDVFFTYRMMCWGWATWRDRWQLCDWSVSDLDSLLSSSGKTSAYEHAVGADSLKRLKTWAGGGLDVWACRWIYAHYKHKAYCVVPVNTLTVNIGRDGTGIHSGVQTDMPLNVENGLTLPEKLPDTVIFDEEVNSAFIQSFQAPQTLSNRLIKILIAFSRTLIENYDNFFLGNPDKKNMLLYGTDSDGWLLPVKVLNKNSNVLSVGAGEDISFDFQVVKEFACEVHILDPTPAAIRHFEETRRLIESGKQAPINHSYRDFYPGDPGLFSKLHYHPYGLWDRDITRKFYAPSIKSHVSHSIANRHNSGHFFNAECLRIKTVLERLSISQLDVLKMDIEGAEYAVIYDMYRSGIRPTYLLVEFHNGKSKLDAGFKPRTVIYVILIRLLGYRLLARRNLDFVFQRRGHSEPS